MSNSAQDADESSWKEKYLELLSFQETQELEHAGELKSMQRCLNRALAAVSGIDADIDHLVEPLKANIQAGLAAAELINQMDDLLSVVEQKELAPKGSEQAKQVFVSREEVVRQELVAMPSSELLKGQVVGVLQTIVDQFPDEVVSRDEKDSFRKRLHDCFEWQLLPELLGEACRYVIAGFQDGRREFEFFLVTLNEKLHLIHGVLEKTSYEQTDVLEQSVQLNALMKRELTQLETSVFEVEDLQQLKTQVKDQLSNIGRALASFQEAQENNSRFISDLTELSARMASVEAEAEELKLTIEKQKASALLDPLTQLPNRQAYDDQVAREIARVVRYNSRLCLAVADIDHFKAINDGYGHLAGDKVLSLVADKLRKKLRNSDFIARYGGEEFVILLQEVELEKAVKTLDKLREAIALSGFHFQQKPVEITPPHILPSSAQ